MPCPPLPTSLIPPLIPSSQLVPGALATYDWQWWDTEVLAGAATTTPNDFFVNVAGKTFEDTNLRQGAMFPPPYVFQGFAISVIVLPDVNLGGVVADNGATAMISILEDSLGVLTVSTKPYFEAPLEVMAAGGGAYGILSSDVDAAVVDLNAALTNGIPSPAYVATFPWPYVIRHNENFSFRVTWGHGIDIGGLGANPRLRTVLKGLLIRGIQ